MTLGNWALQGLEPLAIDSASIFYSPWLVLLSFPFALDKSRQWSRKDLSQCQHVPWPETPVFLVRGGSQFHHAFKHLKALLTPLCFDPEVRDSPEV